MPARAEVDESETHYLAHHLRTLQDEEAKRLRKSAVTAGAFVLLAALMVAALVLSANAQVSNARAALADIDQRIGMNQAKLAAAQQELMAKTNDLAVAEKRLAAAREDVALLEQRAAALTQIIGNVPQTQRQSAINQQAAKNPNTDVLLPRTYVQITNPQDRAWAKDVSKILERSGYVVPGIEYVAKAAAQKTSDVRYYKQAEKPQAENIVAVLAKAGIEAKLIYLNKEDSTAVRPNHYEVWLVRGRAAT